MERKLLKEEIKEIEMPCSMKERIIENCRNAEAEEKENIDMKKIDLENNAEVNDCVIERNVTDKMFQKKTQTSRGRKWTRLATVAAAVALCLGLGGITVMAASGNLEGVFTDVTRWDGAIIGTTYEQATEEIEVSATISQDSLIVNAVLLKASEAPYVAIESFGIQAYQIKDGGGNVVAKGSLLEKTDIVGDKISMELPLDALESGSYTLIITEFVGSAKAEQDLPIRGYWECEFEL